MDAQKIREQFPILRERVNGKALVYFDNGATHPKPTSVVDAEVKFYHHDNANVHRGVHALSQRATDSYEGVRNKLCKFFGTNNTQEYIFSSGTTASFNLLSTTLAPRVEAGDTIVVTRMEHHANFVPWQQLALSKKAKFEIVELKSDFTLDRDHFKRAMAMKPKIVSFSAMSNVLGHKNPVSELATLAKQAGAIVLVDGAQLVAHDEFKISDLGLIDAFVFSAHKISGPTGVGVMWAREEFLKSLPPYQFGGDMITFVEDQSTIWNELPWKFEAGTPNIAGVIGLGAALDFMTEIGRGNILKLEHELVKQGLAKLKQVKGLKILGSESHEGRAPIFSFILEGVHPHDIATLLDLEGIAVRAGHHCAQPLLRHFNQTATTRASLSYYNTAAELDVLVSAIENAKKVFSRGT
ncbi:MAG: SufS family cysteine desulfurase [Xanthomonadaceae bacterium]|nr:SufS family cysteine desulfurase [Xanthomonadaceae bacterium]